MAAKGPGGAGYRSSAASGSGGEPPARSDVDLEVEGLPTLDLPRAIVGAVAAGSDRCQRSAEGRPCLVAEPALNVAVTEERNDLDAEAAAGGAQRPADAAGELMARLAAAPARPAHGARTGGAVG